MTDIILPEDMGAYWQVTSPRKRTPLKRAPLSDLTNRAPARSSSKRLKKQALLPPSSALLPPSPCSPALSSPFKSPAKTVDEMKEMMKEGMVSDTSLKLNEPLGSSQIIALSNLLGERSPTLEILKVCHKKLPSETFTLFVQSIVRFCPQLKHLHLEGPASRTHSTRELADLAMALPQLEHLYLVGLQMDGKLLGSQLFDGIVLALPSLINPLHNLVWEMVGTEDTVAKYFGNSISMMPNLRTLTIIPNRCWYDGAEEWESSIVNHPNLRQVVTATSVEVMQTIRAACKKNGRVSVFQRNSMRKQTPKKLLTWQAGGCLRRM